MHQNPTPSWRLRGRLSPAARRWVRVGALVAVLGGLAVVGVATGVTRELSVECLRAWLVGAGPLGVLGFLAVFALGTLVHVPGMIFVIAAPLAWGQVGGGLIALIGAVLSVTVAFFFVRAVGGHLLGEIKRPLVQRALARLERAPVATVATLRLVLWVSPPVTYALALSRVPLRSYVLGSALGLVLPVFAAAVFVDALA